MTTDSGSGVLLRNIPLRTFVSDREGFPGDITLPEPATRSQRAASVACKAPPLSAPKVGLETHLLASSLARVWCARQALAFEKRTRETQCVYTCTHDGCGRARCVGMPLPCLEWSQTAPHSALSHSPLLVLLCASAARQRKHSCKNFHSSLCPELLCMN